MRTNVVTISMYLKIFLCTESNILLTKESFKCISEKEDAIIEPFQSSNIVDNDESFVIKDNKNSDLTKKFIELDCDNAETIEKNVFKPTCFTESPIKILKQLSNSLSRLLTSSNSFNFVKFLNESKFLIDCYLGTCASERNIRSKIFETRIKEADLDFEMIDKLITIAKGLLERNERYSCSFNFHCIKKGLTGLEKNYFSLLQEFELFKISRFENEKNSKAMKIHTVINLQKRFKGILTVIYNLDDKVIQDQKKLIKNDFLKNVYKIYNNLFDYYENENKILNLDSEILENISINNKRCLDDLISFKKSLEQK